MDIVLEYFKIQQLSTIADALIYKMEYLAQFPLFCYTAQKCEVKLGFWNHQNAQILLPVLTTIIF